MTDLEQAQHMAAQWFEMALTRIEDMPLDEFRVLCEEMFHEVSKDVERRRMRRVTGEETVPWQS